MMHPGRAHKRFRNASQHGRQAALSRAERERRFVLVDFAKDPCAGCSALETETFPQREVEDFIAAQFVPVKLLLNRADDRAHFRSYHVIWTPTIVIMDR